MVNSRMWRHIEKRSWNDGDWWRRSARVVVCFTRQSLNRWKMPHRCVVYGCSNTKSLREGIALHRIPYANDGATGGDEKKENMGWFCSTQTPQWEPSGSSVIYSKHFKEDFTHRLVSQLPGPESLVLAPFIWITNAWGHVLIYSYYKISGKYLKTHTIRTLF